MKFENEAQLIFSPGARVVVGSPVAPLLGAVVIGFVLGLAVATLAWRRRSARRWRRRCFAAASPPPAAHAP